jgi:hypothetical protein
VGEALGGALSGAQKTKNPSTLNQSGGVDGLHKWGHQRKAVALLMTDARKSSANMRFFLKNLL